MIVPYNLQ
jgi:hypothetical protein